MEIILFAMYVRTTAIAYCTQYHSSQLAYRYIVTLSLYATLVDGYDLVLILMTPTTPTTSASCELVVPDQCASHV